MSRKWPGEEGGGRGLRAVNSRVLVHRMERPRLKKILSSNQYCYTDEDSFAEFRMWMEVVEFGFYSD